MMSTEMMVRKQSKPNTRDDEPGTYTVEQAINKIGFGRFQLKLSLVTGLCWMADSMETMILSILSATLKCVWHISNVEVALLTTVVFAGMMIGAPFWGFICDRSGRKPAMAISSMFLFYFGLLSAFAPTYYWIISLRFLAGFCIGGVGQSVTIYVEFLPQAHRGRCLVFLEVFWAVGTFIEVCLALLIMPSLGWRWLLAVSAIPSLIFAVCCLWMPESVRFLAAAGKDDEVAASLKRISKENRHPLPLGTLHLDDNRNVERGRIQDLFSPQIRRTTFLLWFIWLACGFGYYGIVLLTTELTQMNSKCLGGGSGSIETCEAACKLLGTAEYFQLLWTTAAELPGLLFTVLIVDYLGRKWTMAIEFALFGGITFMLLVCIPSHTVLTVILFMSRALVSGVFQVAYLYTPEVYPTTLRAIGIAACYSFARVGAMVTPFIAQVLLEISLTLTISVYGVVGILAALASLILPLETKGKDLQDIH